MINNNEELHSSFTQIIDRLNASPEYVRLFHEAFPETRTNGITRDAVKNAIAVYERTLTGLNSRFDRYMQGDTCVLNAQEVHGSTYIWARPGVAFKIPHRLPALTATYAKMNTRTIGGDY